MSSNEFSLDVLICTLVAIIVVKFVTDKRGFDKYSLGIMVLAMCLYNVISQAFFIGIGGMKWFAYGIGGGLVYAIVPGGLVYYIMRRIHEKRKWQ